MNTIIQGGLLYQPLTWESWLFFRWELCPHASDFHHIYEKAYSMGLLLWLIKIMNINYLTEWLEYTNNSVSDMNSETIFTIDTLYSGKFQKVSS